MKLLCFDRMEDLDFPRFAEIYRESYLATISYFFPEETDQERGLRKLEAKFLEYYRTDFFAVPGRRCYVLADRERWVSAIRLYPVPGRPGAWHAEALETAPDCRRRGYARKLMELLCFALAKQGPFELSDSVGKHNEPSLAFHKACGFEIVQEEAVNPLNGQANPRAYGLRYRFDGWEAQALDPAGLSARYAVRRLTEADLPALLALCRSNPLYYRHCPPAPSAESLLGDLAALPPRRTLADKYYLGFFDGETLIAVLDLIPGFPKPEIAFWGFFMLRAERQGRGEGSALVSELCAALARRGFRAVRLGWVRGNPQAERFWKKNGFAETGVSYDAGGYTVVMARRELILPPEESLWIELRDREWPFTGTDHDRLIVRAIVYDDAGRFYFMRAHRDDDFGKATLIETSGGGVEPGESLEAAIRRELREELGAEVEIVRKLGLVSDYYNLIRRHNLNHYFLCRALSFGETHLMPDEIEDFHLSTLRLSCEEAVAEYETRACTPLGRLIAARELPILRRAAELLGADAP